MKIAALIAVLILSGCAEYRAIAKDRGEKASTATLDIASWTTCAAATAGALERKYQLYSNPNGPRSLAWRELCYGADELTAEEQ